MANRKLFLLLIFLTSLLNYGCAKKSIDQKAQESDPVQDIESQLRDIFVLSAIGGNTLNLSKDEETPYIEFQPGENRVMGYSGCNDFNGKLKTSAGNKLSISNIISTLRACDNSEIETLLYRRLENVNKFKRDALKLYLYEGEALLLTFKKID